MFALGVEGEGSSFGVGDHVAGEIVGVALAAGEAVVRRGDRRVALLLRATSEGRRVRGVEVAVAVPVVQEGLLPRRDVVRLLLGGFQAVQGVVNVGLDERVRHPRDRYGLRLDVAVVRGRAVIVVEF